MGSKDRLLKIREEIVGNSTVEGELGFIHSVLGSVALPYRNPNTDLYDRTNGRMRILVSSGNEDIPGIGWRGCGIPYGVKPRLLLIQFCSQAIRRQNPKIDVGVSMSAFMQKLGLSVQKASIRPFKEQFRRLVACHWTLSYRHENGGKEETRTYLFSKCNIHFPFDTKQMLMWDQEIVLASEFFKSLQKYAFPVDVGAVKSLTDNARALDIYLFLQYRITRLKQPIKISYRALQSQFGSPTGNYGAFKRQFKIAMARILKASPNFRVEDDYGGMKLYPSRSSVRKKDLIEC